MVSCLSWLQWDFNNGAPCRHTGPNSFTMCTCQVPTSGGQPASSSDQQQATTTCQQLRDQDRAPDTWSLHFRTVSPPTAAALLFASISSWFSSWRPAAYPWARRTATAASASLFRLLQPQFVLELKYSQLLVCSQLLVMVLLSVFETASGTFPPHPTRQYKDPSQIQILPHLYKSDKLSSFSKGRNQIKKLKLQLESRVMV